MFLMANKYTNIFHSKALQKIPKLEFSAWKYTIWQPCINFKLRRQRHNSKTTLSGYYVLFYSVKLTVKTIHFGTFVFYVRSKRTFKTSLQGQRKTDPVFFTKIGIFLPVRLRPYSETCSNLQHSKLLQKSSVSKFVYSIAKCFFYLVNFTIFIKDSRCHCWSGNTIFEIKNY
jgi:hypothetical protein